MTADVTLLFAIPDPVKTAHEFGWGSLYVDAFVLNTSRNGIITTLRKMNAEPFYDESLRVPAVEEAKLKQLESKGNADITIAES